MENLYVQEHGQIIHVCDLYGYNVKGNYNRNINNTRLNRWSENKNRFNNKLLLAVS